MAWTNIPDSVLQVDKPIRSVDHLALRDNPIAIAHRDPGAPIVQVPVRIYFTVVGGHVWVVPASVSAFRVIAVGGGAGLDRGTKAEDTIVQYDGIILTAGGGYSNAAASSSTSQGGVAVGGDLNINGQPGCESAGGSNPLGFGAVNGTGTGSGDSKPPSGYGAGGISNVGNPNGGAGAWLEKRFVSVGGSVLITVGAKGPGGVPDGSGNDFHGTDGIVIIEY